ncbi:MAG: ABC transporter permease [Chloroflexi bacterium]|nr:ABC transporter permease [Chloroflexota bacterium]
MKFIARFTGLWRLVYARLVNDAALTLSLLFGWVVFVAFISAIPIYSDAVNQKLLAKELSNQPGRAPSYGFYFHYAGGSSTGASWENYTALNEYMANNLPGQLGLPRQVNMHFANSSTFQLFPENSEYSQRQMLGRFALGFVRDLDQRVHIIEGEMPSVNQSAEDGLQVLVSLSQASKLGLQVGDRLKLFDAGSSTAAVPRPRVEQLVVIVGIWDVNDAQDPFWYISPSAFDEVLLLPEGAYSALASSNRLPTLLYNIGWYQTYDGARIRSQNVPGFLGRISAAQARVSSLLSGTNLDVSPVAALVRYQRVASSQAVQLVLFLIPFIGLVIYFIVLVASGAVQRQRLEIAMLKSRGSSSSQVFGLYVLQALLMAIIALILGPILGRLIAKGIGATYAFLSFRTRESLNVAITPTAIEYAVVGLVIAMLATVLPALSASRQTVVGARHDTSRRARAPFWQRFYLDLILMGLAIYAYYVLKQQGFLVGLMQMGDTQSPFTNPLLFLAPSLFIVAFSLLAVRLFPLLIRLPAWISSQMNGVSLLLALRNLTNSGYAHTGLLLILLLTTSLGTFTASAARTMDDNVESQIRYKVGADVVLSEASGLLSQVEAEPAAKEEGTTTAATPEPVYLVQPVEEHLNADGVTAVARVGRFKGSARLGSSFGTGTVLGIDRLDYPKVGYYRRDFTPNSLGDLMNRLAMQYDGIIVSRDVLDKSGLQIGDTLPIQGLISSSSQAVLFTIVGVMDYWATAYPADGSFFVANLEYIFEQTGGVKPWEVWLEVDDSVDYEALSASVENLGYVIIGGTDARAQLDEAQRRPERTGLFGFLSVGFIFTIALSMLAQIIYALLSFRQRFIQFGMIRAIGLTSRQLAVSLSTELALITIMGVGVGLVGGLVTSRLFIPFLQVGYTATDLVPPYMVNIAWGDIIEAVAAILVTSLLTNAGVIYFLSRIRVFEALKLGESLT